MTFSSATFISNNVNSVDTPRLIFEDTIFTESNVSNVIAQIM